MNTSERSSGGTTNCASCLVATIFLILVAIACTVVFLTVLRPREPEIVVSAVRLPTYSIANGSLNFNFSQYASVRNPNRAVFSHYDSSLQLLYSGGQVGFMFIPAGKIDGGQTKYMTAMFSVRSFPLTAPSEINVVENFSLEPSLELESRMRMEGRVRVLHFFTHHVQVKLDCRVAISSKDGSVLGFRC